MSLVINYFYQTCKEYILWINKKVFFSLTSTFTLEYYLKVNISCMVLNGRFCINSGYISHARCTILKEQLSAGFKFRKTPNISGF